MRLTSKFDTSNTKNRITMLSKQRNSQKITVKKITLIPFLALLFCFFSIEANAQDISEVTIEDLVQELSERLSNKSELSEENRAALALLAKSILEEDDSYNPSANNLHDLSSIKLEYEALVFSYNSMIKEYLSKATSDNKPSLQKLEVIYEKLVATNRHLTKVGNIIDKMEGGSGEIPAPPYPPTPASYFNQ